MEKFSKQKHETLSEKEAKMAIDPICLMEIDENHAATKSVYKGQTFYFCDDGCKRKFEEDPEKYVDVDKKES